MSDKVLAKSVHLGLGVDLLGSKTSLNSKSGNELEVTALGIKATGRSGRVVLVPWANIKGVELEGTPGAEAKNEADKKAVAIATAERQLAAQAKAAVTPPKPVPMPEEKSQAAQDKALEAAAIARAEAKGKARAESAARIKAEEAKLKRK